MTPKPINETETTTFKINSWVYLEVPGVASCGKILKIVPNAVISKHQKPTIIAQGLFLMYVYSDGYLSLLKRTRKKATKMKQVTNGETMPLIFNNQLKISLMAGKKALEASTKVQIPVVNQ